MYYIFAGVHTQLDNVDYERNVLYLKEEIARKSRNEANNLEIVYKGDALEDDLRLAEVIGPNATVHCFLKTKKYTPFVSCIDSSDPEAVTIVQDLFNMTAHVQINVNSRVNILQKILAEYPEFRRNLGAQALIRDSVLFNTLHQTEVVKNIVQHYPLICEAAPFIVDVIKKELTRTTSTSTFSEPATDSTNSSEEDNSLGASNTTERADSTAATPQSENARIRMITRQQLQSALEEIGFASDNSLANIAQERNSDTNASTSVAPNSSGGERIPSELFRSQLDRVLTNINATPGNNSEPQQMETSETPAADSSMTSQDMSDDGSGDIPPFYRTHIYSEQLRTMAQMGFTNYQENLTYLNLANGNIENAINLLMGAMN